MSGTLEDLAKAAKVAASTVSRALSGRPGVSEAKRKMIVRLAEEMGFEPNMQARILRTGGGAGLAVFTAPKTAAEISIKREALMTSMGKAAFGSVHVEVLDEGDDINRAIHRACAEKYSAILVNGQHGPVSAESAGYLAKKRVPLCSVDALYEGFDNVLINRATGTYQAARMLLLSGCRNPVFFTPRRTPRDRSDPRMRGVLEGFRSLGKTPSDANFVAFDHSADSEKGFAVAGELLNSRDVDGIFAYCDSMAVGVLRALCKAGLRVPEDVRLIGFDDIPVSAFLPVSLTTAVQPLESVVEKALELLKARGNDFDAPPRTVSLPTRLVARESSPVPDPGLRARIFEIPDNLLK